jgi:hypothetical protein
MLLEVILRLPEDLVRDARELGILEEGAVAQLLQDEIDRRVNALVDEEIHLYRDEKRRKKTAASS